MTVSFAAIGSPKGQPRARAYARNMGGKYVARMYDAGTADEWKQTIASALLAEVAKNPILGDPQGPVDVTMLFLMPRPKSHHGARGLKDSAPRHHVAKPDTDNLVKLVMDVITRTELVWQDDSCVVSLMVEKRYATGSEHPGCVVTISESPASSYLPAYRLQRAQLN